MLTNILFSPPEDFPRLVADALGWEFEKTLPADHALVQSIGRLVGWTPYRDVRVTAQVLSWRAQVRLSSGERRVTVTRTPNELRITVR